MGEGGPTFGANGYPVISFWVRPQNKQTQNKQVFITSIPQFCCSSPYVANKMTILFHQNLFGKMSILNSQ